MNMNHSKKKNLNTNTIFIKTRYEFKKRKKMISLSNFIISEDEYEIIEYLDGGNFGAVFKVKKKVPEPGEERKFYALKKMKMMKSKRDSQDFIREVEIVAHLSHPAILPFRGFTISHPYIIISDFMPNGNVGDMIELESLGQSKWDATQKFIIMYGIAEGLRFLHSKNVLHRDLKPENVLLDDKLYPYISDFGFSKFSSGGQTQSIAPGSPSYMAPELCGSNPRYSFPVDIYAYGMTLYAITQQKRLPFSMFQNISEIFDFIKSGKRPEFDEFTTSSMKKLINQCWAQNPNERLSFYKICRRFLNGQIVMDEPIDKDKFQEYVAYLQSSPNYSSLPSSKLGQKSKPPKGRIDNEKKKENIQPKISQKENIKPKISQKEIDDFDAKYENDSNHKSDSKFTRLHFAAMINSKEIGELLISKGADINTEDIIYQKIFNIIFN